MNKIAIFLLSINISHASSIFVPDSDTALLIQILGTEIEATAGILEIIHLSSKTVDKIQDIHFKVDDLYTRAMQAEYYANVLLNYPKNREEMQSMVNLRNNLYDAKVLFDDRDTLTLGYDVLKTSNDKASAIAAASMKENEHDRKLAMQYLKGAGRARKTGEGAVYGARASALTAVKLVDMSDSLDLLSYQTLVGYDYKLIKERQKRYEEYQTQKRWGMIGKNTTFEEYIGTNKRSRYADRSI